MEAVEENMCIRVGNDGVSVPVADAGDILFTPPACKAWRRWRRSSCDEYIFRNNFKLWLPAGHVAKKKSCLTQTEKNLTRRPKNRILLVVGKEKKRKKRKKNPKKKNLGKKIFFFKTFYIHPLFGRVWVRSLDTMSSPRSALNSPPPVSEFGPTELFERSEPLQQLSTTRYTREEQLEYSGESNSPVVATAPDPAPDSAPAPAPAPAVDPAPDPMENVPTAVATPAAEPEPLTEPWVSRKPIYNGTGQNIDVCRQESVTDLINNLLFEVGNIKGKEPYVSNRKTGIRTLLKRIERMCGARAVYMRLDSKIIHLESCDGENENEEEAKPTFYSMSTHPAAWSGNVAQHEDGTIEREEKTNFFFPQTLRLRSVDPITHGPALDTFEDRIQLSCRQEDGFFDMCTTRWDDFCRGTIQPIDLSQGGFVHPIPPVDGFEHIRTHVNVTLSERFLSPGGVSHVIYVPTEETCEWFLNMEEACHDLVTPVKKSDLKKDIPKESSYMSEGLFHSLQNRLMVLREKIFAYRLIRFRLDFLTHNSSEGGALPLYTAEKHYSDHNRYLRSYILHSYYLLVSEDNGLSAKELFSRGLVRKIDVENNMVIDVHPFLRITLQALVDPDIMRKAKKAKH